VAATPEKKVKDAVVKVLRSYGVYHFFPVTGGFGRSGIPDIIACYKGNFIGIECKAGSNKPTALQEAEMAKISKAGGVCLVVSEKNTEDVLKLLETIDYMRELSERN
jgi:Holliday junction resolvase